MRGTIFGYCVETPCPHCGAPRVGVDGDDDYYITPGTLLTTEPTCSFSGYSRPSGEKFWTRNDTSQTVATVTVCPICGGELVFFPRSKARPEDTLVCDNTRVKHTGFTPVKGCPKCKEQFSMV